ncbi:sodium/calcium exchanger NCL-like [Amaranthus tricolor]|uniref:sodium/calcium exchanger NCL-like n=1 Tax=Amaranthus tricolor TaxID=29722 RepID=UPI0025907A0C|nr:sodium/calcium exchanger NCL-like [Amaranthus tricolor]
MKIISYTLMFSVLILLITSRVEGNNNEVEEEESCKETYGFLPCTSTALGNSFLIVVYGYMMFSGATYLSNGCELLLEILGPGVIGGSLLPVIASLPEGIIILATGLNGSIATAQEHLSIGVGLLAGSAVMTLTLIWGTCVLIGKCDLDCYRARDETDTKGFNLVDSGVATDIWTSYAARIMTLSIIPLFIVQLQKHLHSSSGRNLAVLIALIMSILMLISYCLYQIFQPWVQARRLDYVKHKRVMTGFLKHLKQHALGRLCNHDGSPNMDVLAKVYEAIDQDGDGALSEGELKAFVIGMHLEGMSVGTDDIVHKVLQEFDTERRDGKIDFDEFKNGISKLLSGFVKRDRAPHESTDNIKYIDAVDEEAEKEHFLLGDFWEEGEKIENTKLTTIKAILLLVAGAIITAAIAHPLIDVVENFSDATTIPSFFISFLVLPLIINSGGAFQVIYFASKKKRRSASLAFCELYAEVTKNNLVSLSTFLALVYVRGLTWDFSSEVLIIFLVCFIMGNLASFRTIFPLWTAILAYALYPFSLVIVYVLNNFLGWQ